MVMTTVHGFSSRTFEYDRIATQFSPDAFDRSTELRRFSRTRLMGTTGMRHNRVVKPPTSALLDTER